MTPMTPLTIDGLIDILHGLREILPGDTPMAHALDDQGELAELLGEIQAGFLVAHASDVLGSDRLGMIVSDDDVDGIPDAQRVLVLWPMLPEVTV